jgi:hypothetical protein
MQLSEDLRRLAARMRCGDPNNPGAVRATLEASLVPMIRCAIRNGTGLPALVRWVRGNLADQAGGLSDAVRAAPVMARQLCSALLGPDAGRHPHREARCETVLG